VPHLSEARKLAKRVCLAKKLTSSSESSTSESPASSGRGTFSRAPPPPGRATRFVADPIVTARGRARGGAGAGLSGVGEAPMESPALTRKSRGYREAG